MDPVVISRRGAFTCKERKEANISAEINRHFPVGNNLQIRVNFLQVRVNFLQIRVNFLQIRVNFLQAFSAN